MTLRPRDLTPEDAAMVLRAGVTRQALTDAIAVASLFNIITRYADALAFAIRRETNSIAQAACCLSAVTGLGNVAVRQIVLSDTRASSVDVRSRPPYPALPVPRCDRYSETRPLW